MKTLRGFVRQMPNKIKVTTADQDRPRGDSLMAIKKKVMIQEPICRKCQDRLAIELDHIIPLSMGGHGTDPKNLQPLCVPCHRKKHEKKKS